MGTNLLEVLILDELREDFPETLVRNDIGTYWDYGATYTFNLVGGQVLYYGYAVVLYQILDVLYVYEDGRRERIGKSTYVRFIEKGKVLEYIKGLRESPEYRDYKLNKSLERAFDKRIKELGNDYYVDGCYFVSNGKNVLLTEEDVLREFKRIIEEHVNNLYIDLLTREKFTEGRYRLSLETLEVGYSEEGGWGVLLSVGCQNYKTLRSKEYDFIYHTHIQQSIRDPKLSNFKVVTKEIVKRFIKNNPVKKGFGIELRFIDEPINLDVYRKIRVEEEDYKRWENRFENTLNNYKDQLNNFIKGLRKKEGLGYEVKLKNNMVVVFGAGGVVFRDGTSLYIKEEMNLREGLLRLSKILGKNHFTLEVMKTYDYRKRVEEGIEN